MARTQNAQATTEAADARRINTEIAIEIVTATTSHLGIVRIALVMKIGLEVVIAIEIVIETENEDVIRGGMRTEIWMLRGM